MMAARSIIVFFAILAPLHAALLGTPAVMRPNYVKTSSLHMCAARSAKTVDVEKAATAIRSFLAATERGDAEAAAACCTDDLLYKTHSATTDSLAGAEKRLHTKVPKPSKVTTELHEESCDVVQLSCVYSRDIVVKPVPFVTVSVKQEFEVRETESGDVRLCRAEYIKL